MSRLHILQVGPATSVQDYGRIGGQRYGLGTAGALDRWSLARANGLVGAAPGAAAIEIGPFGCRMKAEGGAIRLALCGADRQASIEGRVLRLDTTALIAEGEVLDLKAARAGTFSYLAIEGGIKGEPVFGSFSVHARAGLGVPFARPLASGDKFEVGTALPETGERCLPPAKHDESPIRLVLGPQDDFFADEAIATLFTAEWTISRTSDRMGYRLEGPELKHAKGHNIVSDGIANGAIQVPGNGQPLVLLADRGTTGGYPKIGVVISGDLHRFAQIQAGKRLRFAPVSVEEAQAIGAEFAAAIAALPGLVTPVASAGLDLEALLTANLAGQAVDAINP